MVAVALAVFAEELSTAEAAAVLGAVGFALGTVFFTVEVLHRRRNVYRAAAQDAARIYADVTVLLGRLDREADVREALEEARDTLASLHEAQVIISGLPEAPLLSELHRVTRELERRVGPYHQDGELPGA